MSVRGYAIKKVIYHNDMEPFFSEHNEEFTNAVVNMNTLNNDGGGVVCISREDIENILEEQKNCNNENEKYSEETINICKKILKLMNETKEDYIDFWCW